MMTRARIGIAGILLAAGAVCAQTVVISNNFDGVADDIGPAFQGFGNGSGDGTSADPLTGIVYTGSNDTAGAYGFNNVSTTNLSSASSFTVEWVVDSYTGTLEDINYHGFFFGVVAGDSATGTGGSALFNNDPDAVGIQLFTDKTYSSDMSILQYGSSAAHSSLGVSNPDLASLQDGFTLSFTLNMDNTWSASSTGLSTDFDTSGTLSDSAPLFADVAEGLGVYSSLQGEEVGYTLGQVTLTADYSEAVLIPSISASATNGYAPLKVAFDGSGSVSSEAIVDYAWEFGDDNTADGVLATNTYTAAGTYAAWLIVTDEQGNTASNSVQITVEDQPIEAVASASTTSGEVSLQVIFDGSDSTASTGASISEYAWSFGDGNSDYGVVVTNTYVTEGDYTAKLIVTDSNGQSDTNSIEITVTAEQSVSITTQASGTSASDSFPESFIPVSSTDLANTNQASFLSIDASDVVANTACAVEDGFNGTVPSAANTSSDRVIVVNETSITINFDTSINTSGYDITNVNTYASWSTDGYGRANQGYDLTVTFMDGSTQLVCSGTYEANDEPNSWTAVYISGKDGDVIASGVKAVTFSNFDEYPSGTANIMYREFDVLGTPTPPVGVAVLEMTSDGKIVLSWDGGDLDLMTNGNLAIESGWGVLESGASSPFTNDVGDASQLFYKLQ